MPSVMQRTPRRSPQLRTMLVTTITIAAVVVIAVLATGGTYARWNGAVNAVSSTTITSGTSALAIATSLSMPTTPLYPGFTSYGSAALKNNSSARVSLALRATGLTGPATATTFSQALRVGVATAATAAGCAALPVSAWTYGTFTAPFSTASITGATLASGATAVICVSTTLDSTVATGAQGQSAAFTIAVDGVQA